MATFSKLGLAASYSPPLLPDDPSAEFSQDNRHRLRVDRRHHGVGLAGEKANISKSRSPSRTSLTPRQGVHRPVAVGINRLTRSGLRPHCRFGHANPARSARSGSRRPARRRGTEAQVHEVRRPASRHHLDSRNEGVRRQSLSETKDERCHDGGAA